MKLFKLLSIVLLTTTILLGCNNEVEVYEDDFEWAMPFEKKISDNVTVMIDPKIEAAYLVLEMLYPETGYTQTYGADSMEKQKEAFSDFRDHEVFEITLKMFNRGFNYDAVASVLHYYDDTLKLKENIIPDEHIINRAGGYDQIDAYLEALYDFRKVSDFDASFRKNEDAYKLLLDQAYDHIINTNMETIYIDYFGQSLGEVKVFLSPDSNHGYGCRNVYEDRMTLMPTLSVSSNEKGFIKFLLHEIGHSYVNPQNELRKEAVNELAYLIQPIKKPMAQQAYENWETILNEHIVRATVIDMMESIYGKDIVEELIVKEKEKRFDYIEEILDSLDQYKMNREKYRTLNLYFDQLLEDLRAIEV